jgi:hypothetical protein
MSVSGEGSIPRPFNANDVTIWTDLICKFMCHSMNTHFDIGNFLQEVIEDKIMPLNAYDKEMLKKAAHGDKNEFYNIMLIDKMDVELISNSIHNNVTLSINVYNKNSRRYGTSSI